MNDQMRNFREKYQKVSETSKNIILSATFIKNLTKKSQLVWGAVARRDVQELRLGYEPKNFWAEYIETISILKKSVLCFLQQGPLDVLAGPLCCGVVLAGRFHTWLRQKAQTQAEWKAICTAHAATTVFYSASFKMTVA